MTDPIARREILQTTDNPELRHDYIVTLKQRFSPRGMEERGGTKITLRYVPHDLVLKPESFSAYLEGLSEVEFDSLEAVAAAILQDINNEVIPSWVHIELVMKGDDIRHYVTLEDRQPTWRNPDLLDHLKRG